jgi:5'-3' exonuclease
MPTKSLGFLPEGYATIAKGDLKDFFPPDFDIDLNGRALPWEACCLIPFVDEKLFIENEKLMMTNFVLDDYDKKRN